MPVPKRKRSRARRDKRFANKGIAENSTTVAHCSQCQHPLLPHQVCRKCGFYKGVKVMATKDDRGAKRQEQSKKQAKDVSESKEAE